MAEKDLKDKAVEEIIKDTKRAAVRAEIGGPQSWKKGSSGNAINKRFLNNTILGTVIGNNKSSRHLKRGSFSKEDEALLKASAKFTAKAAVSPAKLSVKQEPVVKKTGKVVISTGARYKAYLEAHRLKKEKEEKRKEQEQEEEQKQEVLDPRPQPYYRSVPRAEDPKF